MSLNGGFQASAIPLMMSGGRDTHPPPILSRSGLRPLNKSLNIPVLDTFRSRRIRTAPDGRKGGAMTNLDKLIEAVEAGVDWISALSANALAPQQAVDACRAYGHEGQPGTAGSLDAAKRLHEALLPGWGWVLDEAVDGRDAHVYAPTGAHKSSGTADHIARSWLLAILRALKAQGERE